MNKLNIGVVCYPSYGGSGVVATELGQAIGKRGHHVHFISYETPFRLNNFDEHIQYHEVDMTSYPLFKYPLYSLALTSKIVEVCDAFDLDILHVHYAIPHSICAYLAKQMLTNQKVKFITTLHGTDITLVGQQKSYYKLVQFGIMESDAVTSVSDYLKQLTIDEFKINRDIEVIPNFIDPVKFSPDTTIPDCCLKKKRGEKIVVHISNFRPIKNIHIVIKAFNEMQKKVKCRLALIGDGPEITTARVLSKELGIEDKVAFLSRVEQVELLLPFADLFILPSKLESFGLSILEAMSCGVPTISSNTGGIPEVVEEGLTGFMFDPEDYESMAEKGVEILSNDTMAKEMGEKARESAINRFTQDKIVDDYENLYYRLLD